MEPSETVRPEDRSRVMLRRRHLLRGASGAAPILMTLASRPVTAAMCTPASSFASINASRPDKQYDCVGRKPDYWKQDLHFAAWPAPYIPSSTAVPASGGNPGYTPPAGAIPTMFDSVFGALGGYSGKSLLAVLGFPAGTMGRDALARLIVAALLNATAGLTPSAVLSAQTVRDIWSSFVTRGYYEPTAGIRWYSDSLISWLNTTQPV